MQRSRRWVGFGSSRSVRPADVADIVVRISLPEGKFSFGETTERTHSHADKHWAVLFRAATSSAKPGGLRVSQQRSQEVEAHERLINRVQTPPHPSVFSSRPTASGSKFETHPQYSDFHSAECRTIKDSRAIGLSLERSEWRSDRVPHRQSPFTKRQTRLV